MFPLRSIISEPHVDQPLKERLPANVPWGVAARARRDFRFGSKAETLLALAPTLHRARILDLRHFTVQRWQAERELVVREVQAAFPRQRLVVRSSAIGEDGDAASMAGAYRSCLGVESANRVVLATAIDAVVQSYGGDPRDQVLVQPMLDDIALSGVAMTRNLDDGAPYYVINYDDESGKTDTITGGTGVNKTVLVHRRSRPDHIESPRIAQIVEGLREIERVVGTLPLDVEFGLDRSGLLHVFQVRPIAVRTRWRPETAAEIDGQLAAAERFIAERSAPRDGLLGRRTVLGIMPDWNPAEMIGTTPRPLAASLYRRLITARVWAEARESMGYRGVPGEELMVMIGGRPYIDVRCSFNSLLPAALAPETGARLVDAWVDRLAAHPEFHDKVEFEVAQTCLDFGFSGSFEARYAGLLGAAERDSFVEALGCLTERALEPGAGGSLARAENAVATLHAAQHRRGPLPTGNAGSHATIAAIVRLIAEAREFGTRPFAVLARHGFIAESLLRSAVAREALTPARLNLFKAGIRTVGGALARDLAAVLDGSGAKADFVERYGHLRPGTYDITSARYADRSDLFETGRVPPLAPAPEAFEPTASEIRAIDLLLAETGVGSVDAAGLFAYARRAIVGREFGKFIFTRNLSDLLELAAAWGAAHDLDREALSHLVIDDLLELAVAPPLGEIGHWLAERVAAGRRRTAEARALKLSYLIRDAHDLYVVPLHRSAPNFIGAGRVEAPVVALDAHGDGRALAGRVVCIENADPGFDWIFSRGIAGLVTKFGGPNSHMAIRCAEFGLPAAIGCGEQVVDRIVRHGLVELNCAEKLLRPLTGG